MNPQFKSNESEPRQLPLREIRLSWELEPGELDDSTILDMLFPAQGRHYHQQLWNVI